MTAGSRVTDRRIIRVINVVIRDLSAHVALGKAARIAGMNPTYFSRRFRQVVGVSFVRWTTDRRVEAAKELLATLDFSVTAVAASVGYNDVTTFARAFRRCEGVSPREFRRVLLFRARSVESKTNFAETVELTNRKVSAHPNVRTAEER